MKLTKYMGNPQYLTAKVLAEGEHTIESVTERDVNGEKQVVVLLKGEDRDLRLTPHQVSRLVRAFGDDSEAWSGKRITLKRGDKKGIEVQPTDDGAPKKEEA